MLRFMNKESRFVDTPCGIGIEPLGNMEFITVKFNELQTDTPMYGFWNNPKKKIVLKKVEGEAGLKPPKPKSSGNKLTYAKLYISEIRKYPKDILSYEYAGMCMHLATYIEWNDGCLAIGTGKRKKFMGRVEIAKALEVSDSTVRRFISRLEELKLISKVGDCYKMVGKLFGKGRELTCESSLKKE